LAYEIVQKEQRVSSIDETVAVSANRRYFHLSSGLLKKYFEDCDFAQIFIDTQPSGRVIRIALRPLKRAEENSYLIFRPQDSYTGLVNASKTLAKIGYHNEEKYTRDTKWQERQIKGRKLGVVEFEIERKYAKIK